MPHRVLVVDDYPDVADSLATLLRLHGCEVRTHPHGLGVQEVAAEFRPDAVILDVHLPGRSGTLVAADLAALRPRPRVAVYTGYGWPAELPADAAEVILYKPDPPQRLVDWVLAGPTDPDPAG